MYQTRITKLNEMFDRQQLAVYWLVVTAAQPSVHPLSFTLESIFFPRKIATVDNKYGDI
jgi:hypothetical protein